MADPDVPAPSSDTVRPGEGMSPAEAYALVAPRYGDDGAVLPDHFQQAVEKQPPRKRAAARRRARPDTETPTRDPDADSYDGSGDQEAENPGSS
jgi:hypothetical protein